MILLTLLRQKTIEFQPEKLCKCIAEKGKIKLKGVENKEKRRMAYGGGFSDKMTPELFSEKKSIDQAVSKRTTVRFWASVA